MTDSADRPNLLLIMDDQHRFDWLGCAGLDAVRTPNIDALAARGTRFTRCYTNAPVCAPARIALATGMQPRHAGALMNNAYMPLHAPTYYQRLRDHGYHVGAFGKFDLAKPDPYNGRHGDRPANYAWGFTHPLECEGKMHAGSRRGGETPLGPYQAHLQERGLLEAFRQDYEARKERGWPIDARDSVLPADAFEDAYIGRKAAEWIAGHPGDFPWHCFVSFVGPHDPFDPPTAYAEGYRDAPMPEPIPPCDDDETKPSWVRARSAGFGTAGRTPAQIAEARRQYSAAVEQIDDEVGRILGAVAERGELDNTVVIFTSDHGEMLGDHGLYQKEVAYDAAARVPLIAAGPVIPAGATREAPVELIDLNPTLCELAGVTPLEEMDARSFRPLLHGETTEHRPEAIGELAHFRFACDGRFKAIWSINDQPELYDLADDPGERVNRIDEHGEAAKRLRHRFQQRILAGKWHR